MSKLIILGHPRSGTGTAAALLRSCGRQIGHERLYADGISSWLWVSREAWLPWGHGWQDIRPERVVYLVREPVALVSSVAFTERASEAWRASRVPLPAGNAIERAVASVLGWHELAVANYPCAPLALDHLGTWAEEVTGVPPPGGVPTRNCREHYQLTEEEIIYALNSPAAMAQWQVVQARYAEALDMMPQA